MRLKLWKLRLLCFSLPVDLWRMAQNGCRLGHWDGAAGWCQRRMSAAVDRLTDEMIRADRSINP